MGLTKLRKGQSILEYALLIAVVVAAILVMQVFVKRGYQGNLKDSSDRLGEQFSATGTKTRQVTNMTGGQTIVEETATNALMGDILEDVAGGDTRATDTGTITGSVNDAFSVTQRAGGSQSVVSLSSTDNTDSESFTVETPTSTIDDHGGDYTVPLP